MELLGGQAVIEGVMMKGKGSIAIAVRKKGKIIVKKEKFHSLTKKHKALGLPFIRGVISLFEMLKIGIKALEWSANEALDEENKSKESGKKLSWWHMALSLAIAILLALIIFKAVPLAITKYALGIRNRLLFNLTDGIIRIILFVIYIFTISLFKDVRRLFQYHGAEHKAVSCYEAGKKLTVGNAKKFSTSHPRCGTSFIVIVFLIAIIVFSLTPVKINFAALFFIRLMLLLPIISISYEALKLSAAMKNKLIFRIIIIPGLWFQAMTAREPADKQLEVALAALKQVI